MKKNFCLLVLLLIVTNINAQIKPNAQMKPEETEDWSRKPALVTPGKFGAPPSDAIILYSGPQDTVNWTGRNGSPIRWKADSALTVVPRTGDIKTVKSFGSCQLHVEWRTPSVVTGTSQGRGNSGIFLMEKYELQVLDSWENETYYNGQAGSIYKQFIPLVNASLRPGEWQTYDIVFTAPKFQVNGDLMQPAHFTVFHNGVLILNHVGLRGPTEFIGIPKYEAHEDKLPISLQEHSNPVSYRNIWVREL